MVVTSSSMVDATATRRLGLVWCCRWSGVGWGWGGGGCSAIAAPPRSITRIRSRTRLREFSVCRRLVAGGGTTSTLQSPKRVARLSEKSRRSADDDELTEAAMRCDRGSGRCDETIWRIAIRDEGPRLEVEGRGGGRLVGRPRKSLGPRNGARFSYDVRRVVRLRSRTFGFRTDGTRGAAVRAREK